MLWVLDDRTIGLLIKSKKPTVFSSLSGIHPLLNEAETTGRCIRLEDEYGRMPSDAAAAADIAIGISISSAVTEAVLAGCRGVHLDLANAHWHEFYQWGYGRIIFNDMEQMMSALVEFKECPQRRPEFGDWTPFLDHLDPFRDGQAGKRIGTYMRWCLEGFDKDLDRDQVLHRANSMYADQWGGDKIIDMHSYGN
jgi:hypothetical protein